MNFENNGRKLRNIRKLLFLLVGRDWVATSYPLSFSLMLYASEIKNSFAIFQNRMITGAKAGIGLEALKAPKVNILRRFCSLAWETLDVFETSISKPDWVININ